jgi:D-cysteine desulfhydrase
MATDTLSPLLSRRISLAHLPTPVQFMPRLSEILGVSLFIKRDDLTESIASGNKIRKLEYLMEDALHQKADVVVSYGGIQSNHCRAVAWAAARLGISCVLALRGEEPPAIQGNLLLDYILGADVRFFPASRFQNMTDLDESILSYLRREGKKPYSIPIGGSNAIGTLGYIRMTAELAALEQRFGHIYHALGSGGTFAGMILGCQYHHLPAIVHGIAVCDDTAYFVAELERIESEFREKWNLSVDFSNAREWIDDRYVGIGYALNTDSELRELILIARREGLVLDPVYTLKAFLGMVDHIRKGTVPLGASVLFVHTGGHAGIFPKSAELTRLLESPDLHSPPP